MEGSDPVMRQLALAVIGKIPRIGEIHQLGCAIPFVRVFAH
jgi:hypothetical protein